MKKQRSTTGSLQQTSPFHQDKRLMRMMEWCIIAILFGTTLIIIPNVNDSTFLKQYILYAGTLLLVGIGFYRVSIQKEITINVSFIHLAVVVYFLTLLVSLFKAHNFYLVQQALLFHGCLICVYFLSSHIFSTEESEKRILRWIINLAWLVGGIAIIQSFDLMSGIITALASGRDVISTLGNANYCAGFIIILIPIVFSRLLSEKKLPQRVEMVVLLLVLLYSLLKTETRSSWIAGIVGIIIVLLLAIKNKRMKWGGIAFIIVCVVAISVIFPEIVMKRLSGLFEMDAHSSFTRRLYFYEGAWKAFLSSPIMGNGLGNFILFLPKFRSPEYWIYQSEDIVPHAHNEMLEIASESGVLSLIAYGVILGALFVFLGKKTRSATISDRIRLVGYIGALAAVVIDNLISMNLRTIPVALLFWVIIGITQRYEISFFFSKKITIPPFMKPLRWVVLSLILISVFWIFSISTKVYSSEKAILQGNVFSWNNDEVHSGEKYAEAISFDTSNTFTEYYLAGSYYKLQRYSEALQHISILLKSYPYTPKAHLIAAISSLELKNEKSAMFHIQQELLIESSPQVYYYYAYIVSKSGNNEKERDLLLAMIKENIKGKSSELVSIGIDRLRILCKEGKVKEDYLLLLKDLNVVFEEDPQIKISIAKNYFLMGLHTEAQQSIEQAERIQSLDAKTKSQIQQIKEYIRKNNPPLEGE